MTDLCDEEEAAAEARKHINLATEVDPSNPEGWQVKSYFFSFLIFSRCFGIRVISIVGFSILYLMLREAPPKENLCSFGHCPNSH